MGYELQGLKNTLGASLGMILLLGLPAGCASKAGGQRMAPPSSITLSAQQEGEMTAILVSAAEATPPGDQPLELLPEHGIRWSDARRAMDKAADANELAVLHEDVIDDDHVQFTLVSVEGWPAVVHVQRLGTSPWISASARVGPAPTESAMQQRAAQLEASFMEWMDTFGRIRRVPSIY